MRREVVRNTSSKTSPGRRQPTVEVGGVQHSGEVLVGTALHDLLESHGIKSKRNCTCNAKAAEMDRRGLQWCIDHKEELTQWLVTAGRQRKWLRLVPFKRFGAAKLIDMAIEKAKEAAGI